MAENGDGIDVCNKVDGCTLSMTWVCSVCQGAHEWYLDRGGYGIKERHHDQNEVVYV